MLYNQISSFGAKPPAPAVVATMRADTFPARALAALAVPALLIAATDDGYCPPAVMRRVAEGIPGAAFAELPGGHSAYYESPDRWNDAVLDFTTGQERTGRR